MDEAIKEPVIMAKIQLKYANVELKALSDFDGRFEFPLVEREQLNGAVLVFTSLDYEEKIISLETLDLNQPLVINMRPSGNVELGGVMITSPPSKSAKKKTRNRKSSR